MFLAKKEILVTLKDIYSIVPWALSEVIIKKLYEMKYLLGDPLSLILFMSFFWVNWKLNLLPSHWRTLLYLVLVLVLGQDLQ